MPSAVTTALPAGLCRPRGNYFPWIFLRLLLLQSAGDAAAAAAAASSAVSSTPTTSRGVEAEEVEGHPFDAEGLLGLGQAAQHEVVLAIGAAEETGDKSKTHDDRQAQAFGSCPCEKQRPVVFGTLFPGHPVDDAVGAVARVGQRRGSQHTGPLGEADVERELQWVRRQEICEQKPSRGMAGARDGAR